MRARIKTFQSDVAASLKWFQAEEIEKTLDRSELEEAWTSSIASQWTIPKLERRPLIPGRSGRTGP